MKDKVIIEGRVDCVHKWRNLPALDMLPCYYSRICEECGRSEYYKEVK